MSKLLSSFVLNKKTNVVNITNKIMYTKIVRNNFLFSNKYTNFIYNYSFRNFSGVYVNHRDTPDNNAQAPFDFTEENYKKIDIILVTFLLRLNILRIKKSQQ